MVIFSFWVYPSIATNTFFEIIFLIFFFAYKCIFFNERPQNCLKLIRQVTESESIMKEKVMRQITPRLMVFKT